MVAVGRTHHTLTQRALWRELPLSHRVASVWQLSRALRHRKSQITLMRLWQVFTTMSDPDSYEELLGEIYGPRRELVRGLAFLGGECNSKKLFDVADAPRDSKHYYLTTLADLEVIEKTGTEHAGSGGEAFVWRLTDRGQQVADDIADADATTISDLEELEARVADLERKADAANHVDAEQVQANSEAIEELRADVDTILDRIEAIVVASNGADA